VTSLESPAGEDWRDDGRRRWKLRVESARSSSNVLLTSVFVAVMLSQLLSTTVGMQAFIFQINSQHYK